MNNINRYKTKHSPHNRGLLVEIFEHDNKIGEYYRNYDSMYNTFVPFRQGDKEYALYSRHYTATRVMSLPDCRDLGGEEPNQYGFCPTGFYVPYMEDEDDDDSSLNLTPEDKYEYKSIGPNGQFGFVCGCVWGDDGGGWKLQFLDLSLVSEGIIKRDARFGYIQMSSSISSKNIKDAVYVQEYSQKEFDQGRIFIEIAGVNYFNLNGHRYADSILTFKCPKCNTQDKLRTETKNNNYCQNLFIDKNIKVICSKCKYEETL